VKLACVVVPIVGGIGQSGYRTGKGCRSCMVGRTCMAKIEPARDRVPPLVGLGPKYKTTAAASEAKTLTFSSS
jgi:hypothetical protein